jgi:uncharacterized membrane protein
VTGSLEALGLAMLAFVGGHFLLSAPPLRRVLAGLAGETVFAAIYSILMVLALVWVVAAYRVAPPQVIWDLGRGANLLPIVMMPFAFVLVVLGLLSRNPTAVMGDVALARQGGTPHGVTTITRHPFLAGVGAWALAHLIANGDAASVMLFGGMAVLSVFGMFAIDYKRSLKLGPTWREFASRTSRFPFAAAAAGRTRIDWAGIGWVRPALGLVLYVAVFHLHDRLFGVPVWVAS